MLTVTNTSKKKPQKNNNSTTAHLAVKFVKGEGETYQIPKPSSSGETLERALSVSNSPSRTVQRTFDQLQPRIESRTCAELLACSSDGKESDSPAS